MHRSIGFCPFCAAAESGGAGRPAPGGLRYDILARIDGPTADYETFIVAAEAGPDFDVPRHIHPGIESAYIVAGGGVLLVDGEAPRELTAGDVAQIAARRPHSFRTGAAATRIVSTYILEKGQPISIPA
ncbi:cupin domain-containing protein [Rhodoblastus acidophilus]|uniref:Cupin domain-containing protein n=1 Tax=Candidatus Rhodoblastus alkanivorans TaxID=2954117 RepID=A0ABS9Z9S0_9HYPH|nr:cupin domain-containing protein [Candidatus Rhodoblastus alkanivorans]MCI4678861.1 cupin domain-containing protein [Candidatus Rhodoblastus alkanivorans]MCI4684215.1 cupin domain-containing protein [Candidatus Rhodoblastus alkanivorans]MDI4641536.1 cupin domain-containing protein [Rhodoblastus acidophilus]